MTARLSYPGIFGEGRQEPVSTCLLDIDNEPRIGW